MTGRPPWFPTESASGRIADAVGGEGLLGEPEAARLHQIAKQGADDEGGQNEPAAPKVAQQPAKVPGM